LSESALSDSLLGKKNKGHGNTKVIELNSTPKNLIIYNIDILVLEQNIFPQPKRLTEKKHQNRQRQ